MPANGNYMIAAYIVAGVILTGYALLLVQQGRMDKGEGKKEREGTRDNGVSS